MSADLKQRLHYEIFGCFIVLFLVTMIYRRKNWARWILASCAIFWLRRSLCFQPPNPNFVNSFLLADQLILWIAAISMLFSPANQSMVPKHAMNQPKNLCKPHLPLLLLTALFATSCASTHDIHARHHPPLEAATPAADLVIISATYGSGTNYADVTYRVNDLLRQPGR